MVYTIKRLNEQGINMMELNLISIAVIAIIAIYYGMGRNVEVASGMLTRELEDAQRMQKERIVTKYANRDKTELSDTTIKKASVTMKTLDDLDF